MRRLSRHHRYYRRVLVAMRDWAVATEQIDATALRRRREALERLVALEPPPRLAKAHAAAIAAWRARLESPGELEPAERIERTFSGRRRHDELTAAAEGESGYATGLAALEPLAASASAAVAHAIEHEGRHVLRRLERARPPASEATAHADLLDLVRRYLDAQRRLYDSTARNDATSATDAAREYVRLNGELRAATHAMHERATA